jgi:pyrimidine operon attenuation protein/uracil phosphoribosyltransferase
MLQAHRVPVLEEGAIRRSITRMAHEIWERNAQVDQLVLVGIQTRGAPLARRIQKRLKALAGVEIPLGSVNITFHRDDFRERLVVPQVKGTDLPATIDERTVILVDDVLYTGRTVRAAIDTLLTFGRPAAIQLAVLVDRGHREMPIKADYVGKNIPTHEGEHVRVRLMETDGTEGVYLVTFPNK